MNKQHTRSAARRKFLPLLLLLGWAIPPGASATETGGQMFASVTTQRQERFLHEVFDFTVSVYSRGLTMGREIALLNDETAGLQFRPFRDLGSGHEEVNGMVYDVRRFLGRAEAVATGSFALRPTVRASVVVPGQGRDSGSRRSSGAEISQTVLHPIPVALQVRALPETGKPAGFTGAVGNFTFAAAVRPAEVSAGEPVTLSLDVRGNGNLGSLAAPAVAAGDRFKVYEPKLVKREIGEESSGHLVFEQVLVPRSPAADSVPAVVFSFFDPDRRSYREIARGPFPLSVTASEHPETPLVEVAAGKPVEAKPRLPSAIAPLKQDPHTWLALPARPRYASPLFLALQFIPLAVALGLFFAMRRREELARDVSKARRQMAPSAAQTGIAGARRVLDEGDAARFHDTLWATLSTYFGDRLNLRPGEIGSVAVMDGLARAGLDPRDVARLGEIFGLLERERFGRPPGAAAPLSAGEQRRLATLLEELARLLQACEKGTP